MSEERNTTHSQPQYPGNWRIAADYDPNQHLMNLKGRDYLNVQNRLLWFIRDQRDFIVRGLATTSYVVRTELVEQDREAGYAHFKTYVRDVLGNEATMYGSESAKDFADYAEKASTKSLGRALLALGYGTAFAPEMDEGDRIVDTPVERRRSAPAARVSPAAAQTAPAAAPSNAPVAKTSAAKGTDEPAASEQQVVSIRKLCVALGKPEPDSSLTYAEARQLISQLSTEYQRSRRAS
ncbi:MAG TPA: hypothetical protein VGF38_10325 [Ktedonobacterales bacterium]|jgi:hypothetical protein